MEICVALWAYVARRVLYFYSDHEISYERVKFCSGGNIWDILTTFLPERDCVTFGSLLSQISLSVVCRLSVTLVHPTQEVEAFGNISSPLCTLAIL